MEHVQKLTSLGDRIAGTPADANAADYVMRKLKALGLHVAVEPFTFRSFALTRAVVRVGDQQADVVRLVFDPYRGEDRLEGEVAVVAPEVFGDSGPVAAPDLADKVVITSNPANPFRVNRCRPKAIAYVSAPDLERLRGTFGARATIQVQGAETRVRSANVVATLPATSGTARHVILSAHLDAARDPGANDNASGVAVMLELARHYLEAGNRPPFTLKLVALGAEEVGLVGAKAYLGAHIEELESCALVLNLDEVGGGGPMYTEMRDGVQGIHGKAHNQLPVELMGSALHDIDARWMYIPSSVPIASDVPEWLKSALSSAAGGLDVEFVPSRDMGSDHRVFAQAGIPATNVTISGGSSHSPDDDPAHIVPTSLEQAARLVLGVLTRVPPVD